jgi:putative phosphoesterase
MVTIGVISDTHIPDRARGLNPGVISVFQSAGVEAILHAGDISTSRVLQQLGQVAPVYAVRGNRDWVALHRLPKTIRLTFDGAVIGLAHGHGRWWNYIIDRVDYNLRGYRLELFQPRLLKTFPDVQAIVFGHTHRALNHRVNGVLVFNPGSPHFPELKTVPPSVGLLHIRAGTVEGEIINLPRS